MERWKSPSGRLNERIVHGAAEAGPEFLGLFGGCSRDCRRRSRGEDLDEFRLGVVGEVDLWHKARPQHRRRRRGDDEDAGQAWYLDKL